MSSFFFFQAEDGIRDYKVTGVQTCALPISLCAAGRGWGTPWWANICGSPPPSTVGSARAALQLEQVVELGQHQQESQLLVGPAQAHRQPALCGLPLNQHQGTEARAVDLARAREVDDQAPGTLRQLFQQLGGRTAEHRT